MLDQLKTDLVAQLMLIGVAIAALFACGVISFVILLFFSQPTTPAQQINSEPTVQSATITTPTAAAQSELSENTKKTYLTLLYLEGTVVMLEETANQVQTGQIDTLEAFGGLMAISIVISQTTGALAGPAPDPDMQVAWESGQAASPVIKEVTRRWLNKEIASGDVVAELAPAKESVDQAVQIAGGVIVRKYDVELGELSRVREGVMSELRRSMSEGREPGP